MKSIVFAATFSIFSSHAAAEISYNPNFYTQLSELGLEHEAFMYALAWAGAYNSDAETTVANALLDGIGVEANPKAAIAIVCRSLSMQEFERRKILIQANLRLVGKTNTPLRCEASVD
jgi:hypothetical protein